MDPSWATARARSQGSTALKHRLAHGGYCASLVPAAKKGGTMPVEPA